MAKVPMTAKDFEKVLEEVKELKRKFETALKDEQDAVKMYSEIFRLADRIEPTTYGKMVADIKKQETQHVESLRKMIQNADRRISDSEIMIKSLKKVEEEDRSTGKNKVVRDEDKKEQQPEKQQEQEKKKPIEYPEPEDNIMILKEEHGRIS